MVIKNLKQILSENSKHLYIENDDIEETDVFENKRFDLKDVAKVLVSERYEKAELEQLVFHLLCKIHKK